MLVLKSALPRLQIDDGTADAFTENMTRFRAELS